MSSNVKSNTGEQPLLGTQNLDEKPWVDRSGFKLDRIGMQARQRWALAGVQGGEPLECDSPGFRRSTL
jgi:hypothetical protein